MKYTVRHDETIEVKLEGVTQAAITAFQKLLRLEKRTEKAEENLQKWVNQIPDKDMEHYLKITEQLEENQK